MIRKWRRMRTALLLLASTLLVPQAVIAANDVSVKSSRHFLDGEEPSRTEFGKLIYLSGITMHSDDPDFGGISGLQVSADGTRLLAITDKGKWLGAHLIYEKDRLAGLDQVELLALRGEDGRVISGKKWTDSESLTLEQPGNLSGPAYVSFEGRHRILYYPAGLSGKPSPVQMPSGLAQAPSNKGIEAFGRRADGSFIALAEEYLDRDGNHTGWLVGKDRAHNIYLRREGEFDPTDLEFLPDGDLLVLERRYSLLGGPGMQIRRIRADTIKPDALLDGEVLINLTARYGIDNFEGLAARVNAAGETIIYVVSDNNFNPLQKNLLLMFKLKQQP